MRKIINVLLCVVIALSICSCTEKSQYEKDLESGQRKELTGESKTTGEQDAYDDFIEWKEK